MAKSQKKRGSEENGRAETAGTKSSGAERRVKRTASLAEVYFPDRHALRTWLVAHHGTHSAIWLVYDKKTAGVARALTYDDIVEEALCFGWIDSVTGSVDARRGKLYFSPRKKGSGWSALNKRRIEKLVAGGLMHAAGQAKIDAAKADGSWAALDAIEALEMPADLRAALKARPGALENFEAATRGVRKQYLARVLSAKRPETRAARIAEVVELALARARPGMFTKSRSAAKPAASAAAQRPRQVGTPQDQRGPRRGKATRS